MIDSNPFQPPIEDELPRAGDPYVVHRRGEVLMLENYTELPERCVYCDAPADYRKVFSSKRTAMFSWVGHTWKIRYHICERHRWNDLRQFVCTLGIGASLAGMFPVVALGLPLWFLVLPVSAALFFGSRSRGVPVLRSRRVQGERLHVGGFCEEFLSRFPDS